MVILLSAAAFSNKGFVDTRDLYAINIAVFAPSNCTTYDEEKGMLSVYSAQYIQKTLDLVQFQVRSRWFQDFGLHSHSFRLQMFNVCTDTAAMQSLMRAFTDSSITAVVGPANHLFCESAGALATDYNKALVSWNCIDNVMSVRPQFPTFIRIVPSSGRTARVLAMIFKHFRWKRSAIVFGRSSACRDLAYSILNELTASDLDVTHFIELEQVADLNTTKRQLENITERTKGRDTHG